MPAASIFLFFSAALCVGLAFYAFRQRGDAFTRYYIGLMVISVLYGSGYGAELMSSDLDGMAMALRVQYLGIPFISVAWVGMAWAYLDSRGLPARYRNIMLLISLTMLMVFQGNDAHHLFYESLEFSQMGGMSIAHARKGPLYWTHIAYLNLAIAFGVALFFRAWRQSMRLYRAQSLCLLLGSFFPWGFHLVYLAGWSPYQMDLGPFGLAASGVFFAMATFRFGILEILPVARDLVFDGLSEGVIVVDSREHVTDFNQAATQFVPGLGASAIGQQLIDIDGGWHIVEALQRSRNVTPGAGPLRVEVAIRGDHSGKFCEVRSTPVVDRDGVVQCHALLLLDITEKRQLLAQLQQLATTDSLTGMLNRRQLEEEANRIFLLAQRAGSPLAVALVDVDHFKEINDSRGHQAGDETLKALATLMVARLRSTDIVGRLGGDEFVVVLPGSGVHAALELMQALKSRCEEAHAMTLSIGVAELRADQQSFEALLAEADKQLYRAKRAGRNCVMAAEAEALALA